MNTYLPDYIVVIPDEDLINYLGYQNYGVSTLLGTWIEWLVTDMNRLIQD